MDYDAFERYLDGKDVGLATDSNGNIQANIVESDPAMIQYFMGTGIKQDDVYGKFVSAEVWNGVSQGSDPAAALRILGARIGDDLLPGSSKMISMGADGNITVTDPEAVFARYGINASDLETVINANDPGSGYNAAKTAIQDRLFRISERESLTLQPGEKDPAIIGMEIAAQNEAKRLREENAARLLAEREKAGNTGFDPITALQALLGIGAERGPAELALEKMKADAARTEAERRAAEVEEQSIRPGDDPVDPEDLGYDPGIKPGIRPVVNRTIFADTVGKDPVASFFLRNADFMSIPASDLSAPPSLSTTKIGGAPSLNTGFTPISTINFKGGTTPGRIGTVPNTKKIVL
jgi:hypothetical protein